MNALKPVSDENDKKINSYSSRLRIYILIKNMEHTISYMVETSSQTSETVTTFHHLKRKVTTNNAVSAKS